MSDDLISRKALMERVLQEEYDNDIHKDGRAKAIHRGEYQHFCKTISEMPTAYDVDKVAEKLEQEGNSIFSTHFPEDGKEFMDNGIAKGFWRSAEIVKSGGVADE